MSTTILYFDSLLEILKLTHKEPSQVESQVYLILYFRGLECIWFDLQCLWRSDKHHICTPVDTRFSSFAYATHAQVKNVRARLRMAKPSNQGFIIPPFLHFLVFWLLVFEIHLASYRLHNTHAKDINSTSETIKV